MSSVRRLSKPSGVGSSWGFFLAETGSSVHSCWALTLKGCWVQIGDWPRSLELSAMSAVSDSQQTKPGRCGSGVTLTMLPERATPRRNRRGLAFKEQLSAWTPSNMSGRVTASCLTCREGTPVDVVPDLALLQETIGINRGRLSIQKRSCGTGAGSSPWHRSNTSGDPAALFQSRPIRLDGLL